MTVMQKPLVANPQRVITKLCSLIFYTHLELWLLGALNFASNGFLETEEFGSVAWWILKCWHCQFHLNVEITGHCFTVQRYCESKDQSPCPLLSKYFKQRSRIFSNNEVNHMTSWREEQRKNNQEVKTNAIMAWQSITSKEI